MTTDTKKKGADLSGLDDFNLSDLMSGSSKKQESQTSEITVEAGSISYAPLENFHEDQDNARKEFNLEKLQELADSMVQINPTTGERRGILEPLSCKRHPDIPGHLIILGGNRRFRAAGMAGLDKVPFIIKDELDDFDKFVLNDQRENLTPLEVAMFIKNRLDAKHKAGEIAKALGRPASYVSDHKIFFDMASSIRDLYDSNLCRSMQALALLHRAYKKNANDIDAYCLQAAEDKQELTTSQVRKFLESLKAPIKNDSPKPQSPEKEQPGATSDEEQLSFDGVNTSESSAEDEAEQSFNDTSEFQQDTDTTNLDSQADALLAQSDTDKIKKAIIQVQYDERAARLITNRRAAYGLAWIKYDDDGHEIEVDLNQVKLVAVIEA
ncbi:TPA: ParB/RepB/Spo0J family partition protein [Vibrio parahaemolyticus]|uniref:ParB/RepB/Spo0J family partition protein n=1 Tax=Vibrio alginolyticus TaxID=663 RepID=UPI001EEDA3C7|nr:ParB/RepB/Spo0J family partition protein [Vibrio alginolyticus]ULF72053.1 ParB/RepB/Spo0J family partition protein [Vibrio alginolyticus]HCE2641719.1 ParB/RepB/Spo0J family partition protein [Vibrio parahaemolyticus]HCH4213724.1 ParB/RepB/Spo0J family partition protein [Vibrio parahaemolyticus]